MWQGNKSLWRKVTFNNYNGSNHPNFISIDVCWGHSSLRRYPVTWPHITRSNSQRNLGDIGRLSLKSNDIDAQSDNISSQVHVAFPAIKFTQCWFSIFGYFCTKYFSRKKYIFNIKKTLYIYESIYYLIRYKNINDEIKYSEKTETQILLENIRELAIIDIEVRLKKRKHTIVRHPVESVQSWISYSRLRQL